MKLWAAFQAADINNDNVLNVDEIPILIEIYEGQKPSAFRMEQEIKMLVEIKGEADALRQVDINAFTVTRYQWLLNFCSLTSHNQLVFRSNLYEIFKKYDID